MKKKYILDTSVLLADADSILKFNDNEVILPLTVIFEIDNHKKDMSQTGRNARQVSRLLNKYLDTGDIRKGVSINEDGGTFRVDIRYTVDVENVDLPLDYSINDNRIINCAYINDAIIVSRDVNLRIIASAYGIPSEDYKNDKVDIKDQYTGIKKISCSKILLDELYNNNYVNLSSLNIDEPLPNECYILEADDSVSKYIGLTIYNSTMKEFRLLFQDQKTMGLLPRNTEQQFALQLLLDPDIKLVTICGKAGSGKGILSLAAALDGIMETGLYKKLLVARPIVSLNNSHELGYLKGSLEEKLDPWLLPVYDNIDLLIGKFKPSETKKNKKKKNADIDEDKSAAILSPSKELVAYGLLELGSLQQIRGRSITDTFIIVTEAQNLTPQEVKAIASRVGEGTKIIFEGDIQQTDLPYNDSTSNGLTYCIEKLKHSDITAHITLEHSERSALAELVADTL